MPGPPPTPTVKLAARGSKLAKHRQGEPQVSPGVPTCPVHLAEAAKVEWSRVVDLLLPVGLLTSIDGTQLALYCVAYARWAEAEAKIAEQGTVITSPNGYPIQNPYLSIANGAMDQCFKYLAKFGMNPSDRTRVKVGSKPVDRPATLSDFRLKIAK